MPGPELFGALQFAPPERLLRALVPIFGVVGAIALGFGGRELYHGLRSGSIRRVAATSGGGRVELIGTAERFQRTVTAPLSGAACLAYTAVVEWFDGDRAEHANPWRPMADGSDGVPFMLSEDSAQVLVRGDAEPEFRLGGGAPFADERLVVDGVDEFPATVVDLVEPSDDEPRPDGEGGGSAERFRCVEFRIDADDPVAVAGEARARGDDTTVPVPQNATAVVGPTSEDDPPEPFTVAAARQWERSTGSVLPAAATMVIGGLMLGVALALAAIGVV